MDNSVNKKIFPNYPYCFVAKSVDKCSYTQSVENDVDNANGLK